MVGGGSEHVALVRALWELGNAAPVRKVGKMLDDCRVRRHKADYELETEMDRPTAGTVIEDVREIFATADGFEG